MVKITRLALLLAAIALSTTQVGFTQTVVVDNNSGPLTHSSGNISVGPQLPAVRVVDGQIYTITGSANVTDGNTGGADRGIQLGVDDTDSGHFVMTGGSFTSNETNNNSGNGVEGIEAYLNSTVAMSAGTFTVNEAGRGNGTAVRLNDSSTATFDGTVSLKVTEDTNGNGRVLYTRDTSTATVNGGTFTLEADSGNIFVAGGESELFIHGGTFQLDRDGSPAVFMQVENDATLTMTGGTLAKLASSDGAREFLRINNNGQFIWSGGELPDDGGTAPLIAFQNNSTTDALLNIIGTNFELNNSPIDYGLVAADTGILSGILEDGNAFSVAIDQNGISDRILLTEAAVAAVPEPSSIALWSLLAVVGVVCGVWRGRHSSH